jgi:hypothetical protein
MSTKSFTLWLRWAVLAIVLSTPVACTTGPKVVTHGFSFVAISDSPDVEVLAYRYGDSNLPVSWMPGPNDKSRAPQRTGVYGPMRQGDSLYVKWRMKTTGETYEDTVDLRRRLPPDITKHEIYFMIKGSQLYVYLVPPESKKRSSGTSFEVPRKYRDLDVKTVYPDPSKS